MGLVDFVPGLKDVKKDVEDKITAKQTARKPTPEEAAAAQAQANQDGTVANWDSSSGTFTFRPMNSGEQIERQQWLKNNPSAAGNPVADTLPPTGPTVDNDLVNQALDQMSTPVTNPALASTPAAAAPRAGFGASAFSSVRAPRAVGAPPVSTPFATGVSSTGAAQQKIAQNYTADTTAKQPGDEAPDLDRTKVDNILNGLSGYQNKIADLAEDNTGLSVAEAQLKKATDLANLQAGIDTDASQRAALGAARSSRSRADRSLLERQAVGESAYIGQEAARTASLRQAEQQGNLAELRAQEADYDRRFRLEALGKAADLGLNRSALEVDISKTNLDSATNWINQQFGQLGIDKQLNQEQAQSLLGYTRDMAAIQLQYDQLNSQEQQQADALLMQKYGIDQQTMVAMKELKEKGKFHWDQVLAGVAGGAGTALTGGIAKATGIT